MYRVFISSVQREFSKERKAIAAAIRKDRVLKLFFDPFLFEETVACNRSPQKVYLDEVRSCDVYLGVFGDQYGNMDDAGVSPTEREYDAATEAGKLLKAHDSKPRNEIIARAMSWTSYVEKSGSGTGDIINKCRAWGLPDPEYCPDNVDFKTIIWRKEKVTPVTNLTPVKNLTPDRGGKAKKTRVDALKGLITTGGRTGGKNLPPVGRVTPVVAVALNRFEQIVLALSNGAMGCVDLAQQLGIVETKNLRRRYARVLLDDGIIEFTIPEKPNSRLQKYRLTAKGKRLAAGLRANGGMPVKGEST